MNLVRELGAAFGVDPTRFEAIVDAYESPGIVLPPADRLDLIERRHREAGGGDADKAWLIEEVKKLRDALAGCDIRAQLDEALNSGDGVYRP